MYAAFRYIVQAIAQAFDDKKDLVMPDLLYINASPRGDFSASTRAADVFLRALPGSVSVKRTDLFHRELPDITLEITAAKMKSSMGMELTEEEAKQWALITALVDEFKAADHYLLAIPMWNYNVPYKFKQYIDLITHPGLTFARDANGMKGLVSGGATAIYSRGGDYAPKDGKANPFDFQSPYIKAWLGMIGIEPVNEVLIQNTLARPEGVGKAVESATEQLTSLARAIS